MLEFIFNIANITGLVVFAFVGTIKGIKERLDLFGISVVGYATALGGGTVRDILITKKPLILFSIYDVLFSSLGILLALLVFFKNKNEIINTKFVLYLDAVGLAAFTTTGNLIAYKYETTLFGVIVLGILTGVGGGLISDILVRKTPTVLKEDFYAMCSLLGGIGFIVIFQFSIEYALFLSFLITLFTRLIAIKYNLTVKL